MRSQPTITIATYALLSLAGGISFMMPGEILVPSAPSPVYPSPSQQFSRLRGTTIDLRIDDSGMASRETLPNGLIIDPVAGPAGSGSFAWAATSEFTFRACTDQVVSLDGDETTWLFIDGRLVNGPEPGELGTREVRLDDLDLVEGKVHRLLLVHARRAGIARRVRMRARLGPLRDSAPRLAGVLE